MNGVLKDFLEKERKANRGNQYVESDFDFETVLGHGKFGEVWLATDKKQNCQVAIKKLEKSVIIETGMETQVFHELFIHSQLEHPNIILFLTYFHDSSYLYFIHQFAEMGSLFTLIQNERGNRFNELTAAKYVRQISLALNYMHGERYIHGDVKPENILVDHEMNARLCDFGLSWPYGTCNRDRGYCGTVEYLPPEILNHDFYDQTVDYWSVGILTFELLTGRSPFHNKKQVIMKRKICRLDYKFPPYIKHDARDLISKLLVTNPKERVDLKYALDHPWITRCFSLLPEEQ